MNSFSSIRITLYLPAVTVIAIGLLIRLYACWATYIIPPDGTLYLYQAKMIAIGNWDKVIGCGLSYLSNLPLLIAGAHLFLHDWVIAAQAVSLFFGTATLVWVYLILREFCDRQNSSLATLVLALTPVMVSRSADIVRGPVFWFFLSLSIYAFLIGLKKEKPTIWFIFSQLTLILAVWARIEGLLVIPVSFFYLAIHYRSRCVRPLLAFACPLLVLALAFLVLFVATGKDISSHVRAGDVMHKANSLGRQYSSLRQQIKATVTTDTPKPLRWFLPEARNTVWLIAAGVLLNRVAEGFFYPYLFFYLVGLKNLDKRIQQDQRLWYLVIMTVFICALFYLHALETWILHYRMMVFMMIPGIVFAGFGIQAISHWLTRKYRIEPRTVWITLGVLILIVGLPKNLTLRDPDKMVFRDIGRLIADLEDSPRGVRILTNKERYRWISFYANSDVDDPPCPQPKPEQTDLWPVSAEQLKQSLPEMRKQGIGYYLWEEKSWSGKRTFIDSETAGGQMNVVGQWQHPDTGKMILFAISRTDTPKK